MGDGMMDCIPKGALVTGITVQPPATLTLVLNGERLSAGGSEYLFDPPEPIEHLTGLQAIVQWDTGNPHQYHAVNVHYEEPEPRVGQ